MHIDMHKQTDRDLCRVKRGVFGDWWIVFLREAGESRDENEHTTSQPLTGTGDCCAQERRLETGRSIDRETDR